MRFLFGVVVGIALTLGSAFVHDTKMASFGPDRPFVNWDTVMSLIPR